MGDDRDDLEDARSRTANARYRDLAERRKAENPEYAYAPRWVPSGNWRMSPFDRVMFAVGCAILLAILAVNLLGR